MGRIPGQEDATFAESVGAGSCRQSQPESQKAGIDRLIAKTGVYEFETVVLSQVAFRTRGAGGHEQPPGFVVDCSKRPTGRGRHRAEPGQE
jgi:hypothetical protein